ncbi:MAG: sodium:solute symporter family protein [Sedimentisphaerales bacterium]|nr:sodium:solute symporter family protein [Sedimentisphaerales bacterium]
MEFMGLHVAIWMVLVGYLAGMLLLGWYSKRGTGSQEGYLLGNRRFGSAMMIMHSFGAGTHPGAPAGVISKTVSSGASGIWVSWMWMFGTPFYWLIAPVIRRMRLLTMADYFEQRFGRVASISYVFVATVGMTVMLASVLLATTRTVQGIMGKTGTRESDIWFFGILLAITIVFVIYSYWGGIVAAIRTDMIQGLMIIALSFVAIPAALQMEEVGGLDGVRRTLAESNPGYLRLFDAQQFNWATVLLLSINAPLSMLAMPHLMSVCGAGRTEWEGRVGFTYGNVLKRLCTIGWCILGLCWLAYLIKSQTEIHPDAAFGDSIRMLLSPLLQGVMLACVMAAAMSSGDAVQVTLGGLISQNIYRVYINSSAQEGELVRVTRRAGLVVALTAAVIAVLMRSSVVKTILDYLNILGLIGISVAMGLVWRRMNTSGVVVSAALAIVAFVVTRYILGCSREVVTALPLLAGVAGGIAGSYLTRPPSREQVEEFYKRIYVPIGREKQLELSLAEVVPPEKRLLTGAGLFIIRPSRQSLAGFVVTLAISVGAVLFMMTLLK